MPSQTTENVMLRIFISCSWVLAGCTPSVHDAAMRKSSHVPPTTAQGSRPIISEGEGPAASSSTGQHADNRGHDAQGLIPEPICAAENFVAPVGRPAELPADALGRRMLSAAFVRVGPDGHLTVELRSGRLLVLRNVVMRPKKYCGEYVIAGGGGEQYCGRYADVAMARAGGLPAHEELGRAISNPITAAGVLATD